MILYTLYINVEKSCDIYIYLYKEKKRLTHKLINECASLCYQNQRLKRHSTVILVEFFILKKS